MAKKWIAAVAVAALAAVLIAAACLWLKPPAKAPAAPAKPKLVVVPVDFVLDSPQVDNLIKDLVETSQRDDVAGFILLVNSPGGTVSATEALYSALKGLNKTKYAVVAGLAASGAYYISVAADKIYAAPSSWVGSIGVIAVLWPEEYFYDIPDYVYTTGPLKYYGRELLDYYNDVEQVRLNFVKAVLAGRQGKIKTDPAVFETATVFPASQALELGLVDQIGGLFDAAADMAKRLGLKNYSIVYLSELKNATSEGPTAQWRVDLGRLMNSTPVPIFYIWPGAVQLRASANGGANATLPPAPADKPYVVLDLAHGNMIPRSFIEVLRGELAARGYALVPAASENQLASLLGNATALVVVNPTASFSRDGIKAVQNATARGVRVVYFYDMRASAVVVSTGGAYVAPYSLYAPFDGLLMYYNMSGLRAVYNFTAGASNYTGNWQFVHIKPAGSWPLLKGVSELVLFSPSAVFTNAPLQLVARGYVFGYGWGNYTVAAQAGNFLFVGSVRSFTPYFITMGDNWKFFKNVVDWAVEPRPIKKISRPPPSGVIYATS
ncbi:MAG: S49 family peptidase [Pyrobaculum sp.]